MYHQVNPSAVAGQVVLTKLQRVLPVAPSVAVPRDVALDDGFERILTPCNTVTFWSTALFVGEQSAEHEVVVSPDSQMLLPQTILGLQSAEHEVVVSPDSQMLFTQTFVRGQA